MSRKGFQLNYQVTCTITEEKTRITGELWVWEYASACCTWAAAEVIQIQRDVTGDRLVLQTSELTACKTYSCLDLTLWSRLVFSSGRESNSTIGGETPQRVTVGETPQGIFLSPHNFRSLHQGSLFWDSVFVTQGYKRELLAVSSSTVQGWEGWKHPSWTDTR